MITADTITDEQIRELASDIVAAGGAGTWENELCRWALVQVDMLDPDGEERAHKVHRARARCAEILNARAAGKAGS